MIKICTRTLTSISWLKFKITLVFVETPELYQPQSINQSNILLYQDTADRKMARGYTPAPPPFSSRLTDRCDDSPFQGLRFSILP